MQDRKNALKAQGCQVPLKMSADNWDPKIVSFVDRWSLFRGIFML